MIGFWSIVSGGILNSSTAIEEPKAAGKASRKWGLNHEWHEGQTGSHRVNDEAVIVKWPEEHEF